MSITDPDWPRADVWLARDDDAPEIVVVGVPSSKASLAPSRADLAPLAVRDRLSRFSTFHGETGVDFSRTRVRDLGNWPVSELDMDEMPTVVADLARSSERGGLTLYLGGDNAITRPLVSAVAPDLKGVGLITFDAHHDVRSLAEGPTNGTPVRGLIEEHGLPGVNIVQIGIHSFSNSATYRGYCEEKGVDIETVDAVASEGMAAILSRSLARLSHCSRIFVDVDIDVLDRAFAPACPGSRPGGLSVRQLADGVRLAAGEPKVVAMDFVEVDAEADRDSVTIDVMAHLVLTAVAGFSGR